MTTPMPTFPAGHEPSAGEYQALLPLRAKKTADQTLASNTTLQNDTALYTSTMDPNGVYEVLLYALIKSNSGTNGGLKTSFSLPGSADFSNAIFELQAASRGPAANGTVSGITLATTNSILTIRGELVMGGSAGTLQFQWAQNSSNAATSVVSAGSFLLLRRTG
jgi:hypothetical protein